MHWTTSCDRLNSLKKIQMRFDWAVGDLGIEWSIKSPKTATVVVFDWRVFESRHDWVKIKMLKQK